MVEVDTVLRRGTHEGCESGEAHQHRHWENDEQKDNDDDSSNHEIQLSGNVTVMSKPVGPYTPLVKAGNTLYVSGQLGLADGALVEALDAQVRQAMSNLSALLEAEGASLDNVVKTTVLLDDINDYAEMNAAYTESYLDHRPARAAFAVDALPLGGLVEIEAIAVVE